MEHHGHFEGTEGGVIMAILGYSTSFIGNVLAFGAEVGKAAILGFVGAAFGLLARHLYQKYIAPKKK